MAVAGIDSPLAAHRGGTGAPLVLLHGVTASWRIWEPLIPALEEHHEVFAPTLPGHRGGTVHEGLVSVARLADGVERLLDAEGLPKAHLVGNSLGGWLALELARRGRALSVVALSPAGGWRTAADLRRVTRLIRVGTRIGRRTRPHSREILRRPRGRRLALWTTMERGDRIPPSVLETLLDDVDGCAILDEFLEAIRRDGPFAGDMSHLRCHVRIAWGARDRTIPFHRYGACLLEHVPQAELVRMPGVGHVPMYDAPALITRTILEVTCRTERVGAA